MSDRPKCYYADHPKVPCSGPIIFTAHDTRGCRPVCFAHATWIQGNSLMGGHSKNCPGWPTQPGDGDKHECG